MAAFLGVRPVCGVHGFNAFELLPIESDHASFCYNLVLVLHV